MKLSKLTLNKMKKADLIDYILELQESDNNTKDIFGDIKLHFKRNFENYSAMANGNKKYGFTVTGKNNTLYISWKKYVPSGYLDNGIGGSFEINLNKRQMNSIIKNGFTKSTVFPIIELKCLNETFDRSGEVSGILAA